VGGPYQRRLLKDLLVEGIYDPLERPVKNDSQTLIVNINFALQQIIDFVGEIKTSLCCIFYSLY
jgi:hypothetical protein